MKEDSSNDYDKAALRGGQPYEVGYGKPPKARQFKKGQSGNPFGRPSGTQSFRALVAKAMKRLVTVRGPNGARRITGMQALADNYVALAINGNLKAAQFLVQMLPPEFSEPAELPQTRVTVRFVRPGDTDKDPKIDE
jgi:hypothetical protein